LSLYMLDTNVLSELIDDPHGRIAMKVLSFGPDNLCTSAIVAAELHYGVAKGRSLAHRRRVEELLWQELEVLEFNHRAAQEYGRLRAALQGDGVTLHGNDLLIAAHANAVEAVLVTRDSAFRHAKKHVQTAILLGPPPAPK
jgi:tRNA(fMet)-specific endonuclease VapC